MRETTPRPEARMTGIGRGGPPGVIACEDGRTLFVTHKGDVLRVEISSGAVTRMTRAERVDLRRARVARRTRDHVRARARPVGGDRRARHGAHRAPHHGRQRDEAQRLARLALPRGARREDRRVVVARREARRVPRARRDAGAALPARRLGRGPRQRAVAAVPEGGRPEPGPERARGGARRRGAGGARPRRRPRRVRPVGDLVARREQGRRRDPRPGADALRAAPVRSRGRPGRRRSSSRPTRTGWTCRRRRASSRRARRSCGRAGATASAASGSCRSTGAPPRALTPAGVDVEGPPRRGRRGRGDDLVERALAPTCGTT